jgi:hypothetical protein
MLNENPTVGAVGEIAGRNRWAIMGELGVRFVRCGKAKQ